MKILKIAAIILCSILVIYTIYQKAQTEDKECTKPKNTYLTTLRLNAVEGVTDEEITAFVEKYSQAIIDQGYPDLTYKIWKIYEESPNKVQTYLIEGNWPNRKIWEEIHHHPKYKAVSESFKGKFPTKDGEMVHYTLLKDQLK